jgi:hypothetical protein
VAAYGAAACAAARPLFSVKRLTSMPSLACTTVVTKSVRTVINWEIILGDANAIRNGEGVRNTWNRSLQWSVGGSRQERQRWSFMPFVSLHLGYQCRSYSSTRDPSLLDTQMHISRSDQSPGPIEFPIGLAEVVLPLFKRIFGDPLKQRLKP